MSSQASLKINVSESNGHPTRKFRNIRFTDIPAEMIEGGDELYTFEGYSVRILKVFDAFNTLYPLTVEQITEYRKNGLTEKEMCESNISKTRASKIKIQMLRLSCINWDEPENRKMLMGEWFEFAHGVITCAYLGAVSWGDQFGILLCDATMPLVPENEIGVVCRQVAELARHELSKMEAEKKTTPPPAPPAEKKFTDHFTPASIEAGVSWFKIWIADGESSSHQTLERYNEIFQDCKKWATGENGTDRNINFTWDATDTTREEVDERLEWYYMKSKIFLFMLSIYNKGHGCDSVEAHRNFTIFNYEVEKSGFEMLRQIAVSKEELIGFIGIYTKEEWDALQKGLLTAKVMRRDETQPKGAKLCRCGCGTFQKKLMKASCCGVRYVDAEHQKKDWAEHKKECKKTGLPMKKTDKIFMMSSKTTPLK